MDIGSNNKYPAGKLSNFTPFKFTIDDVKCNSMEGFLQSLKFENETAQKQTCLLVGFQAKKKGRHRNNVWQAKQKLWWKGVEYDRSSIAYQLLLNRVYNCLFTQNGSFRKCLDDAGDAVFTHSIGAKKKPDTVLTRSEFCSRLQHLKDIGLLPE